jgi:hypothetical protein
MKIDIGESLVYSYLHHVKNCYIVQTNWKPSGNWIAKPALLNRVGKEFDKIQSHPAFTEIFKTGFDQTVKQTEIDVLGLDQDETVYAVNVTFHEYGINFGAKTDTRNRVIKNLLRAKLALSIYFPDKKHVLMFCSPRVSPGTEEIINDYFKILDTDFSSEQTRFMYVSNDKFRDIVLMETIDCIQEEFDTSELFLRSFKLMTLYAAELPEEISAGESEPTKAQSIGLKEQPSVPVDMEQPQKESLISEMDEANENGVNENSEDERIKNEITKVRSRVPKWFQHPGQNNSKILITYMNLLEKSETISLNELSAACSEMNKFTGNYAQMINIADKNHGKVFSGTSDNITLWEPVKDFIIQQYIEYKKSYYTPE